MSAVITTPERHRFARRRAISALRQPSRRGGNRLRLAMTDVPHLLPAPRAQRVTARALALGDRIDAAGLERPDTISANPLAFSVGRSGFVALYRFGVAVLVGLSPVEEDDFLRQIRPRVSGERDRVDDETAVLEDLGRWRGPDRARRPDPDERPVAAAAAGGGRRARQERVARTRRARGQRGARRRSSPSRRASAAPAARRARAAPCCG